MKNREFHNQWVGFDLDGTLATYDGYKGDNVVGDPIPAMVERVRVLLEQGVEVRIFTARAPHPAIRRWCTEHIGKSLAITNKKDPGMIAFFDDRGVGVERNTGRVFSQANLKQVEL
jgi:hypothetical protein